MSGQRELNHHDRDQTRKHHNKRLVQAGYFPFSVVISVTFQPVAADCLCHTGEEVNT